MLNRPEDASPRLLSDKRSLQEMHAELRDKYKIQPTLALARTIQQIEAEIAIRRTSAKGGQPVSE
jgi:hypothetical protein